MELKATDSRPLFQVLAAQIEDAIVQGIFPEETQLPSITEYAARYRINPATALKGVTLLVDEGVVYKKRGLGMFVAAGARDALKEKRRQAFYENYVLPMVTEARNLGITPQELLSMAQRGISEKQEEQA